MPNAAYFRAQAKLCLEIAKQISDTAGADAARRVAIENLRRAKGLERQGSYRDSPRKLISQKFRAAESRRR